MLIKIFRKNCLQKFPAIPHTSLYGNKIYYPEVYKSYVFSIDSNSIRSYIKIFSEELEKLVEAFEFNNLIFLGENGLPWLNQKHDYIRVKKALVYLKQNKINKEFNGGLIVDKQDLTEFSKHLFWLIRCCAALPYSHFIDEEQNVVGSICQYGNIHLDTLNKSFDKNFNSVIKNSRFIQIPAMSCYNKFGKTSAIRYRQTIV